MNDSILVPPEVEWYDRSYTIELTESRSGRHCVRIENFAFKNNTFTGEVFAVEAEIDVDVLTVVDQEVNGDHRPQGLPATLSKIPFTWTLNLRISLARC